jgi:hypothetical protein
VCLTDEFSIGQLDLHWSDGNFFFTHGASKARKLPVAPEAKIAVDDVLLEGLELR